MASAKIADKIFKAKANNAPRTGLGTVVVPVGSTDGHIFIQVPTFPLQLPQMSLQKLDNGLHLGNYLLHKHT